MLEFLQECDQYHIYARAHDCENQINAYNSVTPIATFFEVIFKSLYDEFYPTDTFEMDPGLYDILKTDKFVQRVQAEYGFSDFATVDEIRRKSNRLKHSKNSTPVDDKQKKKFFRCLFNFAVGFYQANTNCGDCPTWDDQLYDAMIISENDRQTREEQFSQHIGALSKNLKEEKKAREEASRQVEQLQKQLKEAKDSTVDPKILSNLQGKIQALQDESTEQSRQKILLERRVLEAEKEKVAAEEELQRLQRERKRSSDFETQKLALQQRCSTATEKVNELQTKNEELSKKLREIEEERDGYIEKLETESSVKVTADITALQNELEIAQRKQKEAEKRLQTFETQLAEERSKLFYIDYDHSGLDQQNRAFFQHRDQIAALYDDEKAVESEIVALQDKLPRCPQCRSVLSVGRGNGYYWKCPAWRRDGSGCNAKTRNVSPAEMPLAEELFALQDRKSSVKAEIKESESTFKVRLDPSTLNRYRRSSIDYVAYPSSFEQSVPKAYLFQSLAVPPTVFEDRDNLPALKLFSRFFFSSNLKAEQVDESERTIYSLALRLLNRGIVLPEEHRAISSLSDRFNISHFGRLNSLFEYIKYNRPEFAFDSIREREFAYYYLPIVLGEQWATYTLTQVGFDVLLPERNDYFTDQRVDFLIQKNGKKVIIEIDGSEHSEKQIQDEQRDYELENAGYIVLRFSNNSVERHDASILDTLRSTLGAPIRNEINVDCDDRFLVACKLMHQYAVCILKALEQGMIKNHSNLYTEVSTEMFTKTECQLILTLAIEEIHDIIDNFSIIYDVPCELNLFDSALPHTAIFVGDGSPDNRDHLLIRDCFWPYNCLCNIEPFASEVLPKRADKPALEFFLEYLFGFKHFREGQLLAIQRLLMRKDSIILLPTGAGKSVIYQLSSFIVPGMIVIISPLRSLMDDQISNLNYNRGITNAIVIKSEKTKEGQERKEYALKLIRHNSTSMLYIAPERMQIPSFRQSVQGLMSNNNVYAVAIDEAHCVSEWGHDFRPAYLNISNSTRILFRKGNYVPTIIALTGTASEHVLQDVKTSLEITNPDAIVRPATFDRQELHYSVVYCSSQDKSTQIASLIKNDLPARFGIDYDTLSKLNGDKTYAGIVFAPLAERKKPSQYDALSVSHVLTNYLPEMGISCYFSKTPQGYDEESWDATIQEKAEAYKKNKLNLLVATKAFGMGIDKSNVRYIIHDGIPSSLEEYYQEAGRAGRGRDTSQCILVFSDDQKEKNEPLLEPDLPLDTMQEMFEVTKRDEGRDDLNAILYFHTAAYEGVDKECDVVRSILSGLSSEGFIPGMRRQLILRQSDGTGSGGDLVKKWMQALMRLITLGIVTDYTYDYHNRFELTCGSMDPKDIAAHYVQYIKRDNEQRIGEAQLAMQSIRETGIEFALSAVKVLITYIYDNIEKSRRAAVRLMYTTAKEASQKVGEEQENFFRSAILSYFSSGEKTNNLQRILTSSNAGLLELASYLPCKIEDREYSDEENAQFRDLSFMVGRMLESTPDQPGLLMLRGLCGMILNNMSSDQVASDVLASIRFAKTRYLVDDEDVMHGISGIMNSIIGYYPEIFDKTVTGLDKSEFSRIKFLSSLLQSHDVDDNNRNYILMAYLGETLQEAFV